MSQEQAEQASKAESKAIFDKLKTKPANKVSLPHATLLELHTVRKAIANIFPGLLRLRAK